jgi:hypothetical protein
MTLKNISGRACGCFAALSLTPHAPCGCTAEVILLRPALQLQPFAAFNNSLNVCAWGGARNQSGCWFFLV